MGPRMKEVPHTGHGHFASNLVARNATWQHPAMSAQRSSLHQDKWLPSGARTIHLVRLNSLPACRRNRVEATSRSGLRRTFDTRWFVGEPLNAQRSTSNMFVRSECAGTTIQRKRGLSVRRGSATRGKPESLQPLGRSARKTNQRLAAAGSDM